jgi:hypothetical protein
MRKQIAAATMALASVVGGVALGATVFAPSVSGAQQATTTTTTPGNGTSTAKPAGDCARPADAPRPGAGLDAAAKAIGISTDDLGVALKSGKTIAQVATTHNVSAQTVIDAMVADAKAHLAKDVAAGKLTQAQADARLADATTHITGIVNGTEQPPPPPHDGHRPPPPADDGDNS